MSEGALLIKGLLLLFVLFFDFSSIAFAQGPSSDAIVLPSVPITESTFRQYFAVCHFTVTNRLTLEKLYAAQQRALPPWFPPSVWNDSVQAAEELDATAIALPIYQRYFSEEAGRNAIVILATPAGQAMLHQVYKKTLDQELAGDPFLEAHRKSLDAQMADQDRKMHGMLDALTPQQSRQAEAFLRSAEWKRINDLAPQRTREFNAVYQARQEEAFKAVAKKHQAELIAARDAYIAAHPDVDPDLPAAHK